MTTGVEICDRCGNAAQHLFPDADSNGRICSRCYEGLRLHHQGVVLSTLGILAVALGAAILIAILVVLLTY